jgi:hypothetical protein
MSTVYTMTHMPNSPAGTLDLLTLRTPQKDARPGGTIERVLQVREWQRLAHAIARGMTLA